jgi:hypothetical protein
MLLYFDLKFYFVYVLAHKIDRKRERERERERERCLKYVRRERVMN